MTNKTNRNQTDDDFVIAVFVRSLGKRFLRAIMAARQTRLVKIRVADESIMVQGVSRLGSKVQSVSDMLKNS